nr:DNA topoisomerase 2 [Tanacetum cinerariifolium]
MATDKNEDILNVPKLKDANLAATANSGDCTLILAQGAFSKDLAMSLLSGLSVVGRDCYGVYLLTGKLLNVRVASPHKNADFQNIIKILGLRHGEIYENVEKLRYGHLMIIADQDHDGSRINGLLINFLHLFWPSLLKVPNFFRVLITPINMASNKKTKKVKQFYTIAEYEAWKKKLGDKATNYKIEYYEGLASILAMKRKMYFGDLDRHIKDFFWVDYEDGDAIELAFSNKKIEERKDWLRAFKPSTILDLKEKRIRYRDFIHLDFRQYLVSDLQRSIPSMVDGLKPHQRSILFSAFKFPIIQEINVALLVFSHYVSAHSAYYLDEASLVGNIVGMAQNYVGSNNINLLQPKGQYGTRHMDGGRSIGPACLYAMKTCDLLVSALGLTQPKARRGYYQLMPLRWILILPEMRKDVVSKEMLRIADRGNEEDGPDSRARGDRFYHNRRSTDRGNEKVDRDPGNISEIKGLQRRVQDLEIPHEIRRIQKRIRELELQRELTKETESEPIIWDIGDEEEGYPFFNKYPSLKEPSMLVEEKSYPVYDTDNEEESEVIYDTDGNDVDDSLEFKLLHPDQSESLVIQRVLSMTPSKSIDDDSWQRNNIFRTKYNSKDKVCNMINDGGSCENAVSTYMIEKLALKIVDHHEPYQFTWLKKRNAIKDVFRSLSDPPADEE